MTSPPQQPPGDDPHDREPEDERVLALVRRAREHDPGPGERAPEWEALAEGRLALAEAQRARAQAGDSAATIERASAYFQPFDADEQANLVDTLLAGLAPAQADEPLSTKVIPLRPRASSSRGIMIATLVAIAAALSLWWLWPSDRGATGPEIARVELPAYSLETEGGIKQLRASSSEPEGPLQYRRDSKFEWVLRPQTAVGEPIDVRGFRYDNAKGASKGEALANLANLVELGDTGSIRIRGTIDELGLDAGAHVIVLVVGRPGDMPEPELAIDAIERSGWQVARVDLVVVADSE